MAISASIVGQMTQVPLAKVFVSSGDDVREYRDDARRIIERLINPALVRSSGFLRLDPYFWEDTAAQRGQGDAGVNAVFEKHIESSHLVIVLVGNGLGPGTVAELEKALGTKRAEVSVIILGNATPIALRDILSKWPDSVLWADTDRNPEPPWLLIARPMLELCFSVLTSKEAADYVDKLG